MFIDLSNVSVTHKLAQKFLRTSWSINISCLRHEESIAVLVVEFEALE